MDSTIKPNYLAAPPTDCPLKTASQPASHWSGTSWALSVLPFLKKKLDSWTFSWILRVLNVALLCSTLSQQLISTEVAAQTFSTSDGDGIAAFQAGRGASQLLQCRLWLQRLCLKTNSNLLWKHTYRAKLVSSTCFPWLIIRTFSLRKPQHPDSVTHPLISLYLTCTQNLTEFFTVVKL